MTYTEAKANYVNACAEEAALFVTLIMNKEVVAVTEEVIKRARKARDIAFEDVSKTIKGGETNENLTNHSNSCPIHDGGKCICKFDP